MLGLTDDHIEMGWLVDEHVTYLRSRGKSDATVTDRERLLLRLDADLPAGLAYATQEQLVGWFAALVRAGCAPWTLTTYDMHARGFYRWADGRFLQGDPMAGIERPRQPRFRPRPVTYEQLHLALVRSDSWWRIPILLGALAGLRAGEMTGLRRDDITPEVILIRRAKGGDPATVPTHPRLLELARSHDHEWMLPNRRDGGRLKARSLPPRAREHFDAIGLPGVTLHQFRHYFATSLMRAGVHIRTVQTLMRHANLNTTAAYLLVVDEQRAEGVRRLPPLLDY